jgi:general secretion pathway protein A
MYTEHFGLNEKPFSISPDPRYLYLSQRHADALAHLIYGVSESGGFIQLTGEVGTGKTTLIRSLLGQLPEQTEIALILNPKLSTKQFLQAICQELRVPCARRDSGKALIDKLNEKLLELHADGRRAVLIVDEAQTMSPDLLEQVRLLTNLETEKRKLLQIILIGQPELREILGRSKMRQVAQRITGRYHLEPLSAPDSAVYVSHRMKVAGGRAEIFSKRAIRKLYRLSRGVPRLINVIADRALLAAYARDESRVDAGLVGRAADEVLGRQRSMRWPWAAAIAGFALIGWGLTLLKWPDLMDRIEGGETRGLAAAAPTADGTDSAYPAVTVPPVSNGMPAADSLAELLAAEIATADDALTDLFGLWAADYSVGGGPACDQATAQGLRCFRLSGGSISELRAIDRPAMLELATPKGSRHHLVLLGLDDTHALVSIAGTRRRIPISDLTLFTHGEQLVLFRPAISDESGSLAEGARGAGVVWLRASLASIGQDPGQSGEPDLFDSGLAAVVADYQRAHGLLVDGVVGDRTLISLQSDIGLVGVSLKSGMH